MHDPFPKTNYGLTEQTFYVRYRLGVSILKNMNQRYTQKLLFWVTIVMFQDGIRNLGFLVKQNYPHQRNVSCFQLCVLQC